MKKQTITAACAVALALTMMSGCGKESVPLYYKDGTYSGTSGKDDRGAYGEVTLVIEGGELASCQFVTWQADGSVKDEDYGKLGGEITNKDYYDKAQLAVAAMKTYAEQYEQVKKIEDVDAISGATIAFNQFTEAVTNALKDAAVTDEK
jgi:major membrane immunogen (membrane-anchored lipoprotein)